MIFFSIKLIFRNNLYELLFGIFIKLLKIVYFIALDNNFATAFFNLSSQLFDLFALIVFLLSQITPLDIVQSGI